MQETGGDRLSAITFSPLTPDASSLKEWQQQHGNFNAEGTEEAGCYILCLLVDPSVSLAHSLT
jgi:hypothetical protein